jgi:predicted nuclease of restriction endonuclease-like RecB superfamily
VAPLPTRLLSYTIADGELVPAWLGDRDRPWLRDLLADAAAFAGRPVGDLAGHWRRSDADPRAGRRQAIAAHVVLHWLRQCATAPSMSAIRRQLYSLTADGTERERALDEVAQQHGLDRAQLADNLFADLPEHRLVRWPEPPPDPSRVAFAANLAQVRSILRHTHSAEVAVQGSTRALLKTAWLLGAAATAIAAGPGTTLRWHHAATASRALPALVALLPWCHRYRLRADCDLGADRGQIVLTTGDPILPGPEPRHYDSRLEHAFARDFRARLPDWLLLREPTPIATANGLAFPDFELRPPRGEAWLCELAGLRDASVLPAKLALLEAQRELRLPSQPLGDEVDWRRSCQRRATGVRDQGVERDRIQHGSAYGRAVGRTAVAGVACPLAKPRVGGLGARESRRLR